MGLGLAMLALGLLAPQWVASDSIYGPEGRQWWLLGMGAINAAGGFAFLLRESWTFLAQPRAAAPVEDVEAEPVAPWAREIPARAAGDFRPGRARRVEA